MIRFTTGNRHAQHFFFIMRDYLLAKNSICFQIVCSLDFHSVAFIDHRF